MSDKPSLAGIYETLLALNQKANVMGNIKQSSTQNTIKPSVDQKYESDYTKWSQMSSTKLVPCGKTVNTLHPGVYEIYFSNNIGVYLNKVEVKTEGLIRFPDVNSDKMINEIKKFWELEEVFAENDLTYKRGMLLYGPPGSGKSSAIQILCADIIERGGIVLRFSCCPSYFIEMYRIIRQIQPEVPIIVIMEDLESILDNYDESEVINILDGVINLDKIVFIATTNYPRKLGSRIINRPSRFDKRIKIEHPNDICRKMYFEHLMKDRVKEIDLAKWVKDTKGFSLAHLKELYIAVFILQDSYTETIKTLIEMKNIIKDDEEDNFNSTKMGF